MNKQGKQTQSNAARLRANQVWLSLRENMRHVLLSNVAQHADIKILQPKSLQLPVNPISGRFLGGMSGLILNHYAYQHYQSTRIFDPRFAQFTELHHLGLAIRKGEKSINYPVIHLFDDRDFLVEDTGEILTRYVPAEHRYKTYKNIFHIQSMAKPVVPNNAAVISDTSNPFTTSEGLERFAGGIIRQLKIDVRFTQRAESSYSHHDHRLLIGTPNVFESLYEFYGHLFHQIVVSILPIPRFVRIGIVINIDVVAALSAMMLANMLLMEWKPVDSPALLERIEARDTSGLFFDVMVAEQVYRYLTLCSRQFSQIALMQVTVASRICSDFSMFTQSEGKGVQTKGKATLQESEETQISF